MSRPLRPVAAVLVSCAALLTGCPNEDTSGPGRADAAPAVDAAPPDATPAGWAQLIRGAWSLAGHTEGYRCVRLTVTQDLYIKAFRPIAPLGTHHTVLTVADSSTVPDGTTICDAVTDAPRMIFGSGVGSGDLALPDGVAMKVSRGQQLLLNLHLLNAGDGTMTGTSGVDVEVADLASVQHVAEAILAGKTDGLTVSPGTTTQIGTCTVGGAGTVFAAGPHMHKLGVHMKAIAHRAHGGDATLVDQPYSFDQQLFYPVASVAVETGDSLEIDCTYTNPTQTTVFFGPSSNAEMCFTAIYRWPALGQGWLCTQ